MIRKLLTTFLLEKASKHKWTVRDPVFGQLAFYRDGELAAIVKFVEFGKQLDSRRVEIISTELSENEKQIIAACDTYDSSSQPSVK